MKAIALTICATALLGATLLVQQQGGAPYLSPSAFSAHARQQSPSGDSDLINHAPLKLPLVKPKIVVLKRKRLLMLYSDGQLVRTYRVGLGFNPTDDKIREGDGATPEGEFYVFTKNGRSAFYLSLGISYPNIEDAGRGLRDGLITRRQYQRIVNAVRRKATPPQNTALGGQIYIHGNGSQSDWTWGCVALEDGDVKELFGAVPVGTKVIIEH